MCGRFASSQSKSFKFRSFRMSRTEARIDSFEASRRDYVLVFLKIDSGICVSTNMMICHLKGT